MRTQRLLHPDHIMPCILLVTGSVKMCHGFITMLFVEGDAGRIGVGDAGTDIADVLCGQVFLQLSYNRLPTPLLRRSRLT